jgi:hypothetical protein
MTARLRDVKSGPGAPAGALRQLRQALVPALLFGVCARMALPWSVPVEPASGGHASVDEKKAR